MIGVFDSGIGGLTVARELRRTLPQAGILYLGDVARMPYGNKSATTVVQYAREISNYLLRRGARVIVIACNTASAVAADVLRSELGVPVFDVISPAVKAALRQRHVQRIGVLGTRGTVLSGAYQRAIAAASTARVHAVACPMFVPLVEEGFAGTAEGRAIVARTLRPLAKHKLDAAILGCTHYPLLASAIGKVLPSAKLIDSRAVAGEVKQLLDSNPLLAGRCRAARRGPLEVVVTDTTAHFERFAQRIMREPLRFTLVSQNELDVQPQPAVAHASR